MIRFAFYFYSGEWVGQERISDDQLGGHFNCADNRWWWSYGGWWSLKDSLSDSFSWFHPFRRLAHGTKPEISCVVFSSGRKNTWFSLLFFKGLRKDKLRRNLFWERYIAVTSLLKGLQTSKWMHWLLWYVSGFNLHDFLMEGELIRNRFLSKSHLLY